MCLIAGGVGSNLKSKFVRMIEAGKHRGSDAFGVWTDEGVLKSHDFGEVREIPDGRVGLLQCRLAMSGSKLYNQPFVNELALVHNGEVYNYPQLRAYLEERGVSFESDVDSEVILRLLEFLMGKGLSPVDAVRRAMGLLEGDYAVAFHLDGKLYLFRDPVGVRPLYYSRRGFFASEKKVLWSIGEEAIPVNPGELVVISRNGISGERVFSLTGLRRRELSEEEVLKALRTTLRHAVRGRSSKKVGVLFSGGLDSSLIALLASEFGEVVLYTAGAEGSPDLGWARKVAEALGLPLKEHVFDRDEVEKHLLSVMRAIEEPNPMNLSIGLPLYFATKTAAGDGVRILLSGGGADELFGGYHKYLENPSLMESDLLEMGEKNLARDDKIAMLNGVEGRFPYLALPVVSAALNTPLELKIRGGTRKWVLRRLAIELGLPEEVAMREKKAAQYGSGAQKILESIARSRGMHLREFAEALFRETFGGLGSEPLTKTLF